MKYHILFKFLAILLCACALAGCIGSALGIIVLAQEGLYGDVTPDQLYEEQLGYRLSSYAKLLAIRYAAKTLGGCPDSLIDYYLENNFSAQESWYYTICDASGMVLETRYNAEAEKAQLYTYTYNPNFPTVLGYSQDFSSAVTTPEATVPTVSEEYIPHTVRPAPEDTDYFYIENYFLGYDVLVKNE